MGTFEDVDPGWFEDEIVKLFLTRLARAYVVLQVGGM